ncbi:MAG: hypothetical protein O2985_12060, partial [Proteobacteria bacterium]|nr:hypothetical protein [Pseudomonadota bacterium]
EHRGVVKPKHHIWEYRTKRDKPPVIIIAGPMVLFLIAPVFTGIFRTRRYFQIVVTEYLKRAGQERDTFEFIEKN